MSAEQPHRRRSPLTSSEPAVTTSARSLPICSVLRSCCSVLRKIEGVIAGKRWSRLELASLHMLIRLLPVRAFGSNLEVRPEVAMVSMRLQATRTRYAGRKVPLGELRLFEESGVTRTLRYVVSPNFQARTTMGVLPNLLLQEII